MQQIQNGVSLFKIILLLLSAQFYLPWLVLMDKPAVQDAHQTPLSFWTNKELCERSEHWLVFKGMSANCHHHRSTNWISSAAPQSIIKVTERSCWLWTVVHQSVSQVILKILRPLMITTHTNKFKLQTSRKSQIMILLQISYVAVKFQF